MAAEKAANPAHPTIAPFGPVFAANTPPVKHPADSVFFQSCLALYYTKGIKKINHVFPPSNASLLTLSITHSDPLYRAAIFPKLFADDHVLLAMSLMMALA
jgi:hypothetical protein